MKCLLKYQWVKLPRNRIPTGKGVMGSWMKLASRVAFRSGKARYCGHTNDVAVGNWVGGVVGLKSILGIKERSKALSILACLNNLGYIKYDLNPETKKLSYTITDWVVECSGEPCTEGAVYATEGYGFICVPRNITEPLVRQSHVFDELDAWLDLWCHSVWKDKANAFSFLAPTIQFSKRCPVLTLDSVGKRWQWEKTKVWRFFKKYAADFQLHKLPGSYGCIIFNTDYPGAEELSAPISADIMRILDEMRIKSTNAHKYELTDHEFLNRLVTWYSNPVIVSLGLDTEGAGSRVALLGSIYIRAYFSPCCNNRKTIDCQVNINTKYPTEYRKYHAGGPGKRAGPFLLE